jgi:hypothetical protein
LGNLDSERDRQGRGQAREGVYVDLGIKVDRFERLELGLTGFIWRLCLSIKHRKLANTGDRAAPLRPRAATYEPRTLKTAQRSARHACGQGLLLGFTNVAEADALESCRQLERVIGTVLGK